MEIGKADAVFPKMTLDFAQPGFVLDREKDQMGMIGKLTELERMGSLNGSMTALDSDLRPRKVFTDEDINIMLLHLRFRFHKNLLLGKG